MPSPERPWTFEQFSRAYRDFAGGPLTDQAVEAAYDRATMVWQEAAGDLSGTATPTNRPYPTQAVIADHEDRARLAGDRIYAADSPAFKLDAWQAHSYRQEREASDHGYLQTVAGHGFGSLAAWSMGMARGAELEELRSWVQVG